MHCSRSVTLLHYINTFGNTQIQYLDIVNIMRKCVSPAKEACNKEYLDILKGKEKFRLHRMMPNASAIGWILTETVIWRHFMKTTYITFTSKIT